MSKVLRHIGQGALSKEELELLTVEKKEREAQGRNTSRLTAIIADALQRLQESARASDRSAHPA